MYFPSKKDLWIYLVIWICVIACLTPIFIERDFEVLFFTIPLAILLIWTLFTTGYKVNDELLIIQNGPIKKKISIKDIKKISKTKNPLAASALSIDRLEITYGSKFEMELVSPKDKEKFISLLKSINPQIEVTDNIN